MSDDDQWRSGTVIDKQSDLERDHRSPPLGMIVLGIAIIYGYVLVRNAIHRLRGVRA